VGIKVPLPRNLLYVFVHKNVQFDAFYEFIAIITMSIGLLFLIYSMSNNGMPLKCRLVVIHSH